MPIAIKMGWGVFTKAQSGSVQAGLAQEQQGAHNAQKPKLSARHPVERHKQTLGPTPEQDLAHVTVARRDLSSKPFLWAPREAANGDQLGTAPKCPQLKNLKYIRYKIQKHGETEGKPLSPPFLLYPGNF